MSKNSNTYLKGYRIMAGFIQEDLASLLKISRPAFNMKENGINKFTPEEKEIIFTTLKEKIPNLKIEDVFPLLEE